MECVAYHFLNNHVGRHIVSIFQDDNVKIHQAQIVKHLPIYIQTATFFFVWAV